MSVGAVGSSDYDIQTLLQLQQQQGVDPAGGQFQGAGGMDSVRFSKGSARMEEMAQLSKDDPEAFKQMAADVANKLEEQAAGAGGMQGEMLGKMAGKFRSAAESGDINDLRPDGPPSGMQRGGGNSNMVTGLTADMFSETLDLLDATIEESLQNVGDTAA